MNEEKKSGAASAAKPGGNLVVKAVLVVIACAIFYGVKHYAHVKCVEKALEMQCKKINGFKSIKSVDVPWLTLSREYQCSASLEFSSEVKDVVFFAKRVDAVELMKDASTVASAAKALSSGSLTEIEKATEKMEAADDWDVNLGFWGWVGDDYRIKDLRLKQ